MKIKIIVTLGLCWIIHPIFASFTLPDESLNSVPKSSRNMISSTVQKNPIALAQPVPRLLEMPGEKLPTANFTPVISAPQPMPKMFGNIEPKAKIQLPQTEEPKIAMPELVMPKMMVAKATPEMAMPDMATPNMVMPFTPDIDLAQETIAKTGPEPKIDEEQVPEIKKEPGVLYQTKGFVDDDPATVAFNFEEANLTNLISYMEAVHVIKFISEDIVPTAKDIKGLAGHKITFRTNRNLTRKESWDLCITFLHIAGLDVVPMVQQGFYRLVPLTKANNEPIPTYIGVDVDVLPDSDMIVRYVYFARNIDPVKIQQILINMQGGSAKLDVYSQLKGLIFTDRANSIKSLMKIVTELDRAVLPEVLSVVKLKRANAEDVIALYNSLKPGAAGATQPQRAWVTNKKESSIDYFPQDLAMFSDKRTNSLILLGTAKDVQRVEEFITKYVDVPTERGAPPLFTYRLQYTNAKDMTDLLSKVVSYGATTDAGKYGGVRDGIKYFQKMSIVADSWTNSLIINATPEDYQALKPLIDELDVPQKQVGLEVLIVQVKDVDTKTLGAQLSAPNGQGAVVQGAGLFGPTFGQSITAQTSGIPQGSPIVVTNATNTGVNEDFSIKSSLGRLLGNNLVNEVGSILVTFGKPIWAIFKVLKTISSTHIIANPFVVVSNNSTATVSSGEQRRLVSGEVVSSSAVKTFGFTPIDAKLTVTITPTINKGNVINMNINVTNSQFIASLSSSANDPTDSKSVQTIASVANGETLVLGGIMVENYASSATGVPFLEHIPVFGWFFKSKTRSISRDHFLIFICPRLLDPVGDSTDIDVYTNYKLQEAQKHIDLIDETDWFASGKDPIQKAFFGTKDSSHVLQELATGKQFAQRMAIDGKIDKKVIVRREKLQRQKQIKQAEKAYKNEKKIKKNLMSNSVQSTQGVSYVA